MAWPRPKTAAAAVHVTTHSSATGTLGERLRPRSTNAAVATLIARAGQPSAETPLPTARELRHEAVGPHAREAERLVELHRRDQDPGAGGEAHQHRLRQEAHQLRAAEKRRRETDGAHQQRQRGERRQPALGEQAVRAEERRERREDQQPRGVRGPGDDLRALAEAGRAPRPGGHRRRAARRRAAGRRAARRPGTAAGPRARR